MSLAYPADPAPPARGPRTDLVTARDLMRTRVVTVDRRARLSEAARVLVSNGITGAPVVSSNGRIVGVVSLRDLVQREIDDLDERAAASARGAPLVKGWGAEGEALAEDVMTADVRTVPVGASLAEIAEAMKRHRVHRLLVEDQGRYVGLIGTLDVLDVLFP